MTTTTNEALQGSNADINSVQPPAVEDSSGDNPAPCEEPMRAAFPSAHESGSNAPSSSTNHVSVRTVIKRIQNDTQRERSHWRRAMLGSVPYNTWADANVWSVSVSNGESDEVLEVGPVTTVGLRGMMRACGFSVNANMSNLTRDDLLGLDGALTACRTRYFEMLCAALVQKSVTKLKTTQDTLIPQNSFHACRFSMKFTTPIPMYEYEFDAISTWLCANKGCSMREPDKMCC